MKRLKPDDVPAAGLPAARELRGLSQIELARRAGVSRQTIASLEAGTKGVADTTLAAIAEVLAVPVTFLERAPPPSPPGSTLHFRKRSHTTQKAVSQLLRGAALFAHAVEGLHVHARFRPHRLPSVPRGAGIEEIAERCRVEWGIPLDAPIAKVVRVLEHAGVFVGSFSAPNLPVDAFCFHDARPMIMFNEYERPTSRIRFSVAHEAGHLVMHRACTAGEDHTENEANRFAGAFLLPRAALRREFPRRGVRLDWAALVALKRRWGVSVAAIVVRAHQLGIMSDVEYRSANIAISKMGWRTSEPGEPPSDEQPELTANVLQALRERQKVAPSEFASELGLSRDMLEAALGVQLGGPPGNVIPLVRRRDAASADS
jgi:Zn-dependent peptidase ImmA (M78 family)/transcriptional regulator with XRE-family HTH domain